VGRRRYIFSNEFAGRGAAGDFVKATVIRRNKRWSFTQNFYLHPELDGNLTDNERLVLEKHNNHIIVPDDIVCDRSIKVGRVNVTDTLKGLESRNLIECCEIRYEFRHTKISTGLFGINRIFLPSSNIFPTLVASDSNDFITPVSIAANNAVDYKRDFMNHVLDKKQYRKISQTEALRIQGFPDNFLLPESRSRWMKLIGNSVAIPVIEKLVQAIIDTGVFCEHDISFPTDAKRKMPCSMTAYNDTDFIEEAVIVAPPQFMQMSLFEIGK